MTNHTETKKLYHALAKLFHPDLTSDPDDKQWREQLMSQINAAYAERDIATLLMIAGRAATYNTTINSDSDTGYVDKGYRMDYAPIHLDGGLVYVRIDESADTT